MFFNNYNFTISVIDVLHFEQKKKNITHNTSRPFYALSCRYKANTNLQTKDKTFSVNSASIVLVPANVEYTRIAENESMTVIHFIPSMPIGSEIKVFYPHNFSNYVKQYDKIIRIWEKKDVPYRIKSNECLMHIIAMICDEQENIFSPDITTLAVRLIEKKFSNPEFNITYLANHLNISCTYLRRKFEEKYNTSPCTYLIEKRMENATALLETNYFSIKEIAARCGYENEKYFSTAFKKHYGISPSKFK